MEFVTQNIPTTKIWPNTGQISGIPQNPRQIRDEKFEKLVKSIKDHPEMLKLREILVVPYAEEYVAIGGNMRLRAASEVINMSSDEFTELIESKQNLDNFNEWLADFSELLQSKSVPCKVIDRSATIEQIKAYIIKDNVAFGDNDYDLLANEWDESDLEDWGMTLPNWDIDEEEEEEKDKKSVVRLVVEFDGDLSDYDTIKERVNNILEEFPSAKLRD